MTPARWQSLALLVAIAGLVLGFLASIGLLLFPVLPPGLLALAHPLLLALGFAGGRCAVVRGREIDAARWAVVDEPLATAGERQHAHKEAERERRVAAAVLLGAPVFLGYWWLYQFGAAGPGALALPVAGLAGYLAGFVDESRRGGPERRF